MKVWFIAVLLAIAVAATSAVVAEAKTEVVAVTDVPEAEADDEVKVETVGEGEEESETEGKEEEKEEGGSNESSSEENEEENEEEESSTKAAEEVTTDKVTNAPVVYTTKGYTTKPSYVVPTATTYSKVNYIQVPGPVYKPVIITTEAPKPLVVVSEVAEISIPAAVEKPKQESKYVKPIVVTAQLETTIKYAPIVFEKPSSAPVVSVRKSGWVRAPGYNLGYARSESSDPAVVETPKTSAVSSQPAKKVVSRQTYPQWFFKPKSAIVARN